MSHKKVVLKPGKDIPIKHKHHWIFSGAIQSAPEYVDGDILQVVSSNGELLGHAYFNKKTSISGRMLNFNSNDPIKSLESNIGSAIKLRNSFFNEAHTNCFRLINGEGDLIPGLVVDHYADTLVLQANTAGIDRLKDVITKTLIKLLGNKIKTIHERSTSSARKQDGLTPKEGLLFGEQNQFVQTIENDIKFEVDIIKGQKTGLFLDMRNMRRLIQDISNNKTVLNCFSYSGGFSLYALKGGAKKVVSVDISKDANNSATKNLELNKFNVNDNPVLTEDVFNFLKHDNLNYDIVILDPPAFAKKKQDIKNAQRGYKEINKTVLSKMPSNSIMLTCSCSYYVDEELFDRIITTAAKEAGRTIKIVSKHLLAMDHPINPCHKEFDYLKSLLIHVD